MVESFIDEQKGSGYLILQCNRSLDWSGNKVFLILIASVSAVISGGFALLGAWLIFPFAGIEVLLLAGCVVYTIKQRRFKEIILLNEDSLIWQLGRDSPIAERSWPRYWVQFKIERSLSRLEKKRLLICSHGQIQEVGLYLSDEEKMLVLEMLEINHHRWQESQVEESN